MAVPINFYSSNTVFLPYPFQSRGPLYFHLDTEARPPQDLYTCHFYCSD